MAPSSEKGDSPCSLNEALGEAPAYGALEGQATQRSRGQSWAKVILASVVGVMLLGSCFVAAFVGAAALDGDDTPRIKLHGLLAYLGLADGDSSSGYHCTAPADSTLIPKWDPDYHEKPGWQEVGATPSKRFYEACYRAYRCCTTSTMQCAPGRPNCHGCLGAHSPRVVKPPCDKWADECPPGKNENDKCQVTEAAKSWSRKDIIADNGKLPESTKPEWALIFNRWKKYSPTCWKKRNVRYPDTSAFATKCMEVIGWCHQNMKVCPRDGKIFDHTHCKHCMLQRYDGHFAAKAKLVN